MSWILSKLLPNELSHRPTYMTDICDRSSVSVRRANRGTLVKRASLAATTRTDGEIREKRTMGRVTLFHKRKGTRYGLWVKFGVGREVLRCLPAMSPLSWLRLYFQKSTYKVKRHFFRHGRRIAPKFCTHVRIETRLALSSNKFWPTPPHSNRNPFLSKAVRPAAGRPLWTNQLCVASLFGEVLLYQHQSIVTMTKGYIASNNLPVESNNLGLPVEIIRFHTIGFSDILSRIRNHTLIQPHLNCCIFVWGFNCVRLIKLQKNVLRYIGLTSYTAHCDPLFKTFKILKFQMYCDCNN